MIKLVYKVECQAVRLYNQDCTEQVLQLEILLKCLMQLLLYKMLYRKQERNFPLRYE